MSFASDFLRESCTILESLDVAAVEDLAERLAKVRDGGGRLFILGVGGSAGHASHAVNDFRKICDFEAYAPTDNVSELTARVNDEGWEGCFEAWLRGSRLDERDALLVFSVGGGDSVRGVSMNVVRAVELARRRDATVTAIVGRDGGYVGRNAHVAVIIPPLFAARTTPHTEGIAAVLWHLLVSHPVLQRASTHWESLADDA